MENTQDKKKINYKVLIIAIASFVVVVGSVVFYFCYKVEPITDRMVVELGDTVSENYNDYITGMEWSVARSSLDLSGVDTGTVGTYQAYLTHGWQKFTYEIVIEDTVAPVITLKKDKVPLKLGEKYSCSHLIESAEDISGKVRFSLASTNGKVTSNQQRILFEECGEYAVDVTVTDPSGNSASKTVSVIVDTPPVLNGASPVYIAVGSEETNPEIASEAYYLAGVTAMDEVDGDLTERVEVQLEGLDVSTPGEYEISYCVTDNYGLVTEEAITVEIIDKDVLQEKINTHQISRSNSRITGAYNAYDGGYYEEDNVEFIREVMEPAFVQIQPNANSHGSGFIIEITDEYVLVCTNQHVVGKTDMVWVFFHDGYSAMGETIGTDKTIDIALVKIPIENVYAELLSTLKTVHINMSYWESVEEGDDISICMRCINDDGTVWKERDGTLISRRADPNVGGWTDMTQLGWQNFSGCSGSAVLDGHGNLIAMARGRVQYRENGVWHTTSWGVHLVDIVEFYEATMGKKIYYH